MTDAGLVLRGLEELYPNIRFIERLRMLIEHHPRSDYGDMMSRGQIRSKQWLLHELARQGLYHLDRVFICAGWHGLLARLILDSDMVHASFVMSVDNNPVCNKTSIELNNEYYEQGIFDPVVADITNEADQVRYTFSDTIINTSCEHVDVASWWDLIPFGKLVVLQSNNYREVEDHINCVDSVEELLEQAPMRTVHFSGSLQLSQYTRFMVIGRK